MDDEEFSSEMDAIAAMLDERRNGEALSRIEALLDLHGEDIELCRMYIFVATGSGIVDRAIKVAKGLVEAFPNSELESVGLFRLLYVGEQIEAAFIEMRRLLSIGYSSEYDRLLSEIESVYLTEHSGRDDTLEILTHTFALRELLDEAHETRQGRLVNLFDELEIEH